MARNFLGLLFAIVLAAGCGLDAAGLGPVAGEGGQGAGSATGTSAGGGPPVACEQASDCPGADTDCSARVCASNLCAAEHQDAGVVCDEPSGAFCDGAGSCVECLGPEHCPGGAPCLEHQCVTGPKPDGAPCGAPVECQSGACVDQVCCESACGGACQACAAAKSGGTDGLCAFVPRGDDPDLECGADATCSGAGSCFSCKPVASQRFGDGSQDQFAGGVAVDATGNVLLTGQFKGGIGFGGPALTSASNKYDVFVAKLDPTGAHVWSKRFGDGSEDQFATGVVVDAAGNVFVAGRFKGGIDFGGAALTSTGNKYDIYVAKLDPKGTHVWSKRFGNGSQDQFARSVAITPGGGVVVAGQLRETVDFGGGALASAANGKYDALIFALSASGAHLWSKAFGEGSQDQLATGVAVDAAGNAVTTGQVRGTVNFGGGGLASGAGKHNVFAVKLAPDGAHLWSKVFLQASQDQAAAGVAVDAAGNVHLTGRMRGNVDYGGGNVESPLDRDHVFAVKLGPEGNHLWSRAFGNAAQDQIAAGVAVDDAGHVLLTGSARGTIDFGGGKLSSAAAGKYDVFHVKLDPSGAHLCSRLAGDGTSDQYAEGVAVAPTGEVVLTGRMKGTVDFGGGAVSTAVAGSYDVFAASYAP